MAESLVYHKEEKVWKPAGEEVPSKCNVKEKQTTEKKLFDFRTDDFFFIRNKVYEKIEEESKKISALKPIKKMKAKNDSVRSTLQPLGDVQLINNVKRRYPKVSEFKRVSTAPIDRKGYLAHQSHSPSAKASAASPHQTRDSASDSKTTLIPPNSVKTALSPASEPQSTGTESEALTACRLETQTPATRSEVTADLSKKDINLHDYCPIDSSKELETKRLKVENIALKAKIQRLEQNALTEDQVPSDRCPLRIATLQQNLDHYSKKADELSDCFASDHSRYKREQRILQECVKLIQLIESAKSDDSSSTESDIADYKKTLEDHCAMLTYMQIWIMEDRQKTIGVEKQYQKILSDYRHLVRELESADLQNEKMNLIEKEKQQIYAEIENSLEERRKRLSEKEASLNKKQQSLDRQEYFLHKKREQLMNVMNRVDYCSFDAVGQLKEKCMVGKKVGSHPASQFVNCQAIEKSAFENKFFQLKEHCSELTKALENSKAENEDLKLKLQAKNNLSEERESLKKSKIFLCNELKSLHEEYEDLIKITISLEKRLDANQTDLDNSKARLADARKMIAQLETQNTELQETETALEVCETRIEIQQRCLRQSFENESNYLHQIEKLCNENRDLQEANERLKSRHAARPLRNVLGTKIE